MGNEIKEIRTAKITEKGQICIPNAARSLKGFQKGKKISIIVYPNKVELRPLGKNLNDSLMSMFASEEALSKNWLSKEDEEAWKDL